MQKRSDLMLKGAERAPHRSLLRAGGFTERELEKPIIGIANSFNEVIPGHIHLDKLVEAAKAGVYAAGGTPIVFNTIGVCDGIAMNHFGMKYSLPSRELIADSLEIMAMAHPFDGLLLMASCDKIVPGMLIAAARLDIPSIFISGGPMLPGRIEGKEAGLDKVFEAVGRLMDRVRGAYTVVWSDMEFPFLPLKLVAIDGETCALWLADHNRTGYFAGLTNGCPVEISRNVRYWNHTFVNDAQYFLFIHIHHHI